MGSEQCEICGRFARYHETVVTDGFSGTRHFCEIHGYPVWRAALPVERPVRDPLSESVRRFPAE